MNVQRFRGGLVFKARRRVHHSTPGLRVKKKKVPEGREEREDYEHRQYRPALRLVALRFGPAFEHRLCATTDHSENS